MKQMTLNLSEDSGKPLLLVDGIGALVDTGADIPVCWLPLWLLKEIYDAEIVIKNVSFNSFGNDILGDVYRLNMLKVGEIIYPNMHIFVIPQRIMEGKTRKPLKFYFILSASMFSGLIYEIDNVNHKFNVTIPDSQSLVRNVIIKEENGRVHVLCNNA